MTLYRIACRFEPGHPRMLGNGGRTSGAWRVAFCSTPHDNRLGDKITTYGGMLFMTTTASRRTGQLVNPRRVLAEYWQARRDAFRPQQILATWPFTKENP